MFMGCVSMQFMLHGSVHPGLGANSEISSLPVPGLLQPLPATLDLTMASRPELDSAVLGGASGGAGGVVTVGGG
jgi:hypothetical protein